MLQNHSRCRNGRGCGQHPSEADGPGIRGGGPSEQGSVNDSEEDRRFFADFEGSSVFDWENISVRSMYREEYEKSLRQRLVDTLGGGDAISIRTEAWVASTPEYGQDPDEAYQDEHCYHDEEEEERREGGLKTMLKEMRRRDSEEGWPLDEQMAALEREDREDIQQIMREELGWSKTMKKKTTGRKKRSGVATTTTKKTTTAKKRKASLELTPTTSKRRR